MASDLVIVSRALTELADFLQGRQESVGRGRVVLDRRVGDRRVEAVTVEKDRRRNDRRQPASAGAEALMRVLGFSVVPSGDGSDGAARRAAARRARPIASPAAPARRVSSARRSRRRTR